MLVVAVRRLDLGRETVVLVDIVVTDATTGYVLFTFGMRIELPDRLACVTVERCNQIFRGAGVQNTTNLQRGVFVHTRARARGSAACSVSPGNLQLIDVFRSDLRVGCKPGARRIAAKELPVFRG
ncbi:hypothetical protein D3C77_644770 [compost metagenome]